LFFDLKVTIPPWLVIRTLDDLKGKLVGVVVVVLAVTFLDSVGNWKGGIDVGALGIGVAAVIAALVYFIRYGLSHHDE
jgi:uncharacterized membrane protein YqhA